MIGIINFITIMLLINALVYFFNHLDMLPIYKGGLDLQSFCDYIDKNSDPEAPLTFLTIDVENGVPRYEKAPYHVLPGELFAYEIELIGGIKPIFCLVLKHDYDHGIELTKEILLDQILRPHLEKHRRDFYVMDVFDENNEYYLSMLAQESLFTKLVSPQRNVFHCQGNGWNHSNPHVIRD